MRLDLLLLIRRVFGSTQTHTVGRPSIGTQVWDNVV
jgi:hypothetical protein